LNKTDRQVLFDIGDQVTFWAGSDGKQVGTVAKLNPKRAKVNCDKTVWNVPYSILNHSCDTIGSERSQRMQRLQEVSEQAQSLMNQYGLHNWSFQFNGAQKQLGSCNYTKRQITLSRIVAVHKTAEQVTDVILHEIAHALAGWEAGHGPKWKEIASRLGARPESRTPESDEIAEIQRTIKKNIQVGNTVTFEDRKGRLHQGVVLRKNPKTAKVKCPEDIWLVAYAKLTIL